MELRAEELAEIMAEVSNRILERLTWANQEGGLQTYLASIGCGDVLRTEEQVFETDRYGKILIVGDIRLRTDELYGSMTRLGISRDRIERVTYDEVPRYPFRNLQYNPNFRIILFGPLPHSASGKGHCSSILSELEQGDGYPKVIRMHAGSSLKITKSNLLQTVGAAIESGFLATVI